MALEKSTMESIRSIQHRDINGDIIGLNHAISREFRILMRWQPIPIDLIPHALDLNDPLIPYEHLKLQLMEHTPVEYPPEQVRENIPFEDIFITSKLTDFFCRL